MADENSHTRIPIAPSRKRSGMEINMRKMLLLTLNEQEEKVIDKIIAAIAGYIRLEPMQVTPASVLSFPGLEIRQSQL